MDDLWENEVLEYGAVNITGFRIIDHSRKIVRDFMDGLRRMDSRSKDTISVSALLSLNLTKFRIDAFGIGAGRVTLRFGAIGAHRLFLVSPPVSRSKFLI